MDCRSWVESYDSLLKFVDVLVATVVTAVITTTRTTVDSSVQHYEKKKRIKIIHSARSNARQHMHISCMYSYAMHFSTKYRFLPGFVCVPLLGEVMTIYEGVLLLLLFLLLLLCCCCFCCCCCVVGPYASR